MKKILLIIALLFMGCTKEMEYPDPPKEIDVKLKFDKFIKDPFDDLEKSSSAREASEFTHILSNSTNVELTATPENSDVAVLSVTTRVSEISNISLTLNVGTVYLLELVYDRTLPGGIHKADDNGLAFDGISALTLITDSTDYIMINCSTEQSLILVDKDSTDVSFETKFSDGSIKEDSTVLAWLMFDSPHFWYLYTDPVEGSNYFVQYKTIGGVLKNVKFPAILVPEYIYFISEVEEGNTELSFDYDSIFGNLIVVGS